MMGSSWSNDEGFSTEKSPKVDDSGIPQLKSSSQAVPSIGSVDTPQTKSTSQEATSTQTQPNQLQMGKNRQKKPLGFQAFEEPAKPGENAKKVKTYQGKRQAVEPVSGIHSMEWAAAVISQASPLLNLPIELRWMIWSYVISAFCMHQAIEPHRHGKAFRDPKWKKAGAETNSIITICKQLYLDVVAGGLVYKYKAFFFPGQVLVRQFLWSIRPSHKNTIRSIQLTLTFMDMRNKASKESLIAIRGLESLQHFELKVDDSHSAIWLSDRYFDANKERDVVESDLSMLSDSQYLRSVTGLLSFKLHVSVSFGRKEQRLSPETQNRVCEIERDLKEVMLLKRTRNTLN